MRDIGRYLYFKPRGGGASMSLEFEKQILVAGVGNAWMLDDGFGSVVAQRLEAREMPRGVTVMDVGSGGLDLAYEIMRGYHALVLVDVSRQGGEPGTLYVIEPDLEEIAPSIEDGEVDQPARDGPGDGAALRRAVGGWSGKVVIVACEPGEVEELGLGLSPALEAAVDQAIALVDETIAELRTDAAYKSLMHELSVAERGGGHGAPARGGPARVGGHAARRAAAPGRPGLARVLLRTSSTRDTLVRGRAAGAGGRAGAAALRRRARTSGSSS